MKILSIQRTQTNTPLGTELAMMARVRRQAGRGGRGAKAQTN